VNLAYLGPAESGRSNANWRLGDNGGRYPMILVAEHNPLRMAMEESLAFETALRVNRLLFDIGVSGDGI